MVPVLPSVLSLLGFGPGVDTEPEACTEGLNTIPFSTPAESLVRMRSRELILQRSDGVHGVSVRGGHKDGRYGLTQLTRSTHKRALR